MSKETKIALIGAAATIIAAIIGAIITGYFALHSTASSQSDTSSNPPPVSRTSAPIQSTSSATFSPIATQPGQQTYTDIRGTYFLISQNTVTGYEVALNLVITQQNQQSFQGVLSKDNRSTQINNGTVDQNRDIRFTSLVPAYFFSNGTDTGNQTTVTYTGTPQSGGGWQGTWSATDGSQGTWSAV